VPTDALATTARGAGSRLVLVHGFTQTARSWDSVAEALAAGFEVVVVDAPGHGDSAAVRAGLRHAAVLLGAAGGRATYVGYSMGGRMCLQLALDAPRLVERLVLISATAGIEDETERAARRQQDEALAGSLESDGLDPFLQRWVAQPLFAGLADPGMADRRRNTVDGLASSLRLAGTGTMTPAWHRLGAVDVPVLLVAGSLDTRFVGLAERMAAAMPQADLAIVEGAGHSVHLEQPAAFLDVLTTWLRGRAGPSVRDSLGR